MQTALLAQKNSEATRLLTLQEDILEKELGEIQKVLFAMQVNFIYSIYRKFASSIYTYNNRIFRNSKMQNL